MKNDKKSVLVIGIGTQVGLAIIRSLSRKSIKVYGLGSRRTDVGLFSKYLTKGYVTQRFGDNAKFIETIILILKENNIDYVIAISESMLVTLNKHREKIEKFSQLLIPSEETLSLALNKDRTSKMAEELGIPVPVTCRINKPEELAEFKDFSFPVVIKPSKRFDESYRPNLDFRMKLVYSYTELTDYIEKFTPAVPLTVQEYCAGDEIGFAVLMKNGKCLACFQYKILRNSPPIGGVPVYRESVAIDPLLKEYSVRLLKAMNWEGVAELDYITDKKDKKIKFLEVNGRFWGSLPLTVKAGVDFPHLFYRAFAESSDVDEVSTYKLGVRSKILGGDIRWLLYMLFDRQQSGINGAKISKFRTILEYIKSLHPSVKYDIESFDDPLPGIVDILLFAKKPLIAGRNLFNKKLLTIRRV